MTVSAVAHRSTTRYSQTAPSLDAVAQGRGLIRQGMTGDSVRTIQALLNRHGANLQADGDFGPKTRAAVVDYQRRHGLEADGIVGPRTLAKLRASGGGAPVNNDPPTGPTQRVTGYRNGRPFPLTVARVENGEYLSVPAAAAYQRMDATARRDGVNLNLVSGFRSMDEQRHLYQAYLNGTGNLAARPGYSNHQNGIAVDIETGGSRSSAAYRRLRDHGGQYGFRNTVPSEPWHWEYRG